MEKHLKYLLLICAVAFASCAKRGTITGGLKDTIPPVLVSSNPENFSTNFKGNTIRLNFDEYVKLKNANKQLIISPPMQKEPTIFPSNASKFITIKINDTLQPNTTYSFNFGQSIEDNNESNPYSQFKYVFSTGSYIDSLKLGGRIKDARDKKTDNFVSVMLYEANDTFTDSTIYKNVPRYITNTLDSLQTFQLENLKAGKYLLIALKDNNSNNKFDPKKDKIAFQKEFITIPSDTVYELELFREEQPFKALKPSLASGNKLIMGYEGDPKDIKVTLKHGSDVLPSVVTKVADKDSVHIWYKPIKADSLLVNVAKGTYTTDYVTKIKTQKKDTLSFTARPSGTLPLRGKFSVVASRPLVKFDNSKITLTKKDSSAVTFTTEYDAFNQELKFDFPKEPLEKYTVQLLPGALTDFYEEVNDTLVYKLATKNTSDYGNLRVTLENVRQFPVIVELTNKTGEIMASEYTEGATVIDFNALEPAFYTLRIVYDENKNKVWDSGNFMARKQTEEVIYFPKEIDVRANWDVDQPFKLP